MRRPISLFMTSSVMIMLLMTGCGKKEKPAEPSFDINKEIAYNEVELPEVIGKDAEPIGVSDLKIERTVGGKRNTDIFKFEFDVTNNAPQKERYNIRVQIAAINSDGETLAYIGPVQIETPVQYGETIHVDNYCPATLVDKEEKVTFEVSNIFVQDANLYECNEKLKNIQEYLDKHEYEKAEEIWENTEQEYLESYSEYISGYKTKLKYDGYNPDKLSSGKR